MSDVLEFMVPSRARAKKNWDEGRSVAILAMNNCKTGRCGPLSASASSGRGSEIPHVRPSRSWSRHRRRVFGFRTLSSDSPCIPASRFFFLVSPRPVQRISQIFSRIHLGFPSTIAHLVVKSWGCYAHSGDLPKWCSHSQYVEM